MSATDTLSDLYYDPYDRETALNPHEIFRRLREEAPLYYNERLDFYALSRYEDVEKGHVDRGTFISRKGGTLQLLKSGYEIPPGTVIFEDPPSHTIHRALLSRMFTPKRVSSLEPEIRQLCCELLDPLRDQPTFDLVRDVGSILPTRVIGMLIGIPEQDQLAIRDHFNEHHDVTHRDRDVLSGDIFADYIEWRSTHPADDIMTQLLFAEFEDETGETRRLTRQELLAYVNIVTAAGNDTTKRLLSWAGKCLSDHPKQRRELVENPSLIPSGIEEILRFESPALQSCRYVARDVEYHGTTVPEGSIIALLVASANRDDRKFDDPDRFDIHREQAHHFSFGFGSHYCLGQALARLEARVALEEVLARFPEWEVDWSGAQFAHDDLRGFEALPLSIG